MSRVIDEAEVLATTSVANETRDPTEVAKFFVMCMHSLCKLFEVSTKRPKALKPKADKKKTSDETEETEEEKKEKKEAEKEERFKEYLTRLYDSVIVKGKSFKKDLPTFTKTRRVKDDEEEEGEVDELDLKGKSVQYKVEESIWVAVIKGSEEDKNVRSFFKELPASDDSKAYVPVVTVKLFQAILSLMCAHRGIKGLTPAPLFASIFSSCKDKKCGENNWAYHGHAGINFVANYVQNVGKQKRADESDRNYQNRVAWKNSLPPVHHLLAAAYKLDSNKTVTKDKDSKKTKAQLELEKYSTVRAIVQTCQITDVASYLKLISPKDWGSATMSGTANVVNSFVKGMLTKEKSTKSKSKKKRGKKNQEQESEESEDEESDGESDGTDDGLEG